MVFFWRRVLEKEQWEAIKKKDKDYDNSFVYVNRKTGVICRPSCKKKAISPQNIIIFDTVQEAIEAGYRACKICHPDRDCWKGAGQELTEILALGSYGQFPLDHLKCLRVDDGLVGVVLQGEYFAPLRGG